LKARPWVATGGDHGRNLGVGQAGGVSEMFEGGSVLVEECGSGPEQVGRLRRAERASLGVALGR